MFKSLKEKLSKLFRSKKEKIVEVKVDDKKSEKKLEEDIKSKPQKIEIKEVKEEKKEEEVVEIKEVEEKKEDKELTKEDIKVKVDEEETLEVENKEELEHAIDTIEESLEVKEKPGFFQKLTGKIGTVILNQETFNEFFEELEALLLENNVSLKVVDKIRSEMEQKLINLEIKKSKIKEEIRKSLKESISDLLLDPFDIIKKINEKKSGPFVILFFGINGSGKTTTVSKLANLLKEHKIPCVLGAGDTFRAASIEQLQKHGEKLGIKVISQDYGSDPAAVAFDAVAYAKSKGLKAVLIDTAGRMHTKDNLLKEMAKIIRVVKPDLKIFVAESITGNDATEQALTFNESFGIDATILTKADVDEKGGTAISIGYITNTPILFLGTGQKYKDLEPFSKEEILAKLGLD